MAVNFVSKLLFFITFVSRDVCYDCTKMLEMDYGLLISFIWLSIRWGYLLQKTFTYCHLHSIYYYKISFIRHNQRDIVLSGLYYWVLWTFTMHVLFNRPYILLTFINVRSQRVSIPRGSIDVSNWYTSLLNWTICLSKMSL